MRFGSVLPAAAALLVLSACTAQEARLGDGTPSIRTAETALASGAVDLAYRICSALIDGGDRSTKTLVCKGNALTGLGRSAEASAVFASALQSAPLNSDALIGAGRLRLSTDPAGAEQLFMKALSVQPRDSVALNNLGIARDLQGRHSDAQIAYSEAIGANPDSRAPQVNLALSMAMSGRAREATRIIRPLAENESATARERHDYAAILTMAGRSDEAAQFLSPELTAAQAEQAVLAYRDMPKASSTALASPVTLASPIAPPSPARSVPLAEAAVLAEPPISLSVPVATAPEPLAPIAAVQPIVLTPIVPSPIVPSPVEPAPVPAVIGPIVLSPATDAPPPPAAAP